MLCYFSVVEISTRPIVKMPRKLQKSWASRLPRVPIPRMQTASLWPWLGSHTTLYTYLPKLIRAGERVAICDQLEAPKRSTEEISPSKVESPQQEQNNSSGIHR